MEKCARKSVIRRGYNYGLCRIFTRSTYSLVRNDIGIDILAKKDGKYIYVQCKNYSAGSICILDMAGYFFFKSAHQGKKCKLYYNGYLSNKIKLIHPNDNEFINVPFDNQMDASWQDSTS